MASSQAGGSQYCLASVTGVWAEVQDPGREAARRLRAMLFEVGFKVNR